MVSALTQAPKQVCVKDANKQRLVMAIAAQLKSEPEFKVPAWVGDVKTAAFKDYIPESDDWFYVRAAAIARRLYVHGAGVGSMRKVFGGKNKGTVHKAHALLAPGNANRKAVQSLQRLGWIELAPKGRRITPAGRRTLDKIAQAVIKM